MGFFTKNHRYNSMEEEPEPSPLWPLGVVIAEESGVRSEIDEMTRMVAVVDGL